MSKQIWKVWVETCKVSPPERCATHSSMWLNDREMTSLLLGMAMAVERGVCEGEDGDYLLDVGELWWDLSNALVTTERRLLHTFMMKWRVPFPARRFGEDK